MGHRKFHFFVEFQLSVLQFCPVVQLCLTLCNPVDCSLPGSSVHMGFPRQEYWVGCHFLLHGIFQPKNRACIFCIGRQVLYHWATWEAMQQKWVVNKNEKWERSYSRENQVKCKRMLLAQCVSMSNKKREGVSHYLSSWMVLSSLGVCCKVILKALLIEKAKQWDWRFNWDGHRKEKKWQNMKEMVSTFIQF